VRRWIFAACASLVGLALGLSAAELVVRAQGYEPWTYGGRQNEVLLHEPDPVLVWRSKPGSYVVPSYVEHGDDTTVTMLENGSRITHESDR